MYQINHTAKNELLQVQKKITKELASEKIIQDIYEYIFQAEGKNTLSITLPMRNYRLRWDPIK